MIAMRGLSIWRHFEGELMNSVALLAHNHLPGSDVARCDNSFTRSTEDACQIESFVSSRLDVVRELNDHNVGHCVTILFANACVGKGKTHNYIFDIPMSTFALRVCFVKMIIQIE